MVIIILTRVSWYLIVVLIFIFLIISVVDRLVGLLQTFF